MKRFSPTIPCLLVALAAGFLAAGLLFSRSVFSATVNTSGSVSLPNLSKGLVGWWTMDEKDNLSPTGINDRSGNGNLGTLNGGVSKVSGKIGQGMKFDGNVSNDSKINCGLGTSLNLPSRVTLFGKGYAAAGGYSMHIRSDGSLWFEIDDSDGTRHYYHPTNIYLSTNKWVHVVATYDGTTQRIYVNGVQDGTGQVISSDFGTASSHCTIGWVSGGDYFTGSLDDVRVYNRALSTAEVQQLYKMGK